MLPRKRYYVFVSRDQHAAKCDKYFGPRQICGSKTFQSRLSAWAGVAFERQVERICWRCGQEEKEHLFWRSPVLLTRYA
jgi:hypothetical protein